MFLPENARSSTVPMIPDCSVRWNIEVVPSLVGKLYLSPEATRVMADTALRCTPEFAEINYRFLGEGVDASVYASQGLAIKRFNTSRVECCSGINSLRANIALSTGLANVGPLVVNEPGQPIHNCNYKTPTYYGCFLPDENTRSHPIWLMSYERGVQANADDLPSPTARIKYFESAVQSQRLAPGQIDYDTKDNTGNTPVLSTEVSIQLGAIRHKLVQIDATAINIR